MEISQAEKVMQRIHDRQKKILDKLAKNLKGVKPFNQEKVDPMDVAYYLGQSARGQNVDF